MPAIDAYSAGTPCWADVTSPDVAATVEFYTSLFGWTAEQASEPEAGGYTSFAQGGRGVAAAGPLQGDAPAAWSTYLASDDVDGTAARIESAGGTVLAAPFDVMDYGRMAFGLDPTGAAFGVWQAGSHAGAQLVNEPVSLAWSELSTPDESAAEAFYAAVFGWESESLAAGSGGGPSSYRLQKLGGRAVAGITAARTGDTTAAWTVYFAVADVDATTGRAAALGAGVVTGATDSAYGRMAVLADPHGATFAVIALAAQPAS